jgi:hypothetical protein
MGGGRAPEPFRAAAARRTGAAGNLERSGREERVKRAGKFLVRDGFGKGRPRP